MSRWSRVLRLARVRRTGGPGRVCQHDRGIFPIALCGRSSLYCLRQRSSFSQASSSDRNQCVFTHSLRSLLLNASMNALSVGLPGREKSSVTPLW